MLLCQLCTCIADRAMEFVQHFIAEVAGGEHSLDVAAGKAYSISLRRYHSWIVRGVFNVRENTLYLIALGMTTHTFPVGHEGCTIS